MKHLKTIINESSLSRVWQHVNSDRPFAILTGFRGDYEPEINQQRNRAIAADIKNAGFGYFYLDGYWIENEGTENERHVKEDSIFAIGSAKTQQKFLETVKNLGKDFEQEAILIKYDDKIVVHELATGNEKVLNNFNAGVLGSIYSQLRNNKKANTFIFENERDGHGFIWHIGEAARKKKEAKEKERN